MRILICEDEPEWIGLLKKLIVKAFGGTAEIIGCALPEEVYAVEFLSFDVVLMDIRLENKNGITLASELKARHPGWKFIFVSGYIDEYLEGMFLKIKPYGIWKKPLNEELCIKMLKMAEDDAASKEIVLKLLGGKYRKFDLTEIYYFESDKRIVKIHLAKSWEQCYERLDGIEHRLPKSFLRCHKSFLVNMDKIRGFEKNTVELTDGTLLTISRARMKEVKEKYFRYIGMEL